MANASATAPQRCTEAEYFELLASGDEKLEFVNGQVYAMAGAAPVHVGIEVNLIRHCANRVAGGSCRVFGSNLAIRDVRGNGYFFPDLTIVCGAPVFSKPRHLECLENPIVLFEILSPSTESFDQREKKLAYTGIRSLREYLLVASDAPFVEHLHRKSADELWNIECYREATDVIRLTSCGVELTIGEIYEGLGLR
jgi:Uma2 family endonuclease